MRANISEELLNMIDESIYLQLELHIVDNKINKAETENNEGFANHLRKIQLNIIKQHKETNDYLRQNGIKIHEVEVLDDMFVRYKYHQKINGGFKEGYNQYWKTAMTFNLNKRMKKYFGGGS
jgi:transcriptional accessory protein Tex/SPT6